MLQKPQTQRSLAITSIIYKLLPILKKLNLSLDLSVAQKYYLASYTYYRNTSYW